jgi:hypothetical protein
MELDTTDDGEMVLVRVNDNVFCGDRVLDPVSVTLNDGVGDRDADRVGGVNEDDWDSVKVHDEQEGLRETELDDDNVKLGGEIDLLMEDKDADGDELGDVDCVLE